MNSIDNNNAVDDRTLAAREIADLLAVSQRTFWRLIQRGQFPPADVRCSRKLVRWRLATVRRWLANPTSGG